MKITVIGDGGWGTANAMLLVARRTAGIFNASALVDFIFLNLLSKGKTQMASHIRTFAVAVFLSLAVTANAEGSADKSISINFSSGQNNVADASLVSGDGDYGVYPIKGDLWNNVSVTTVTGGAGVTDRTDLKWSDGQPVEGVLISCFANCAWSSTTEPVHNNISCTFLDCWGNPTWIELAGLKSVTGFSGDSTLYIYYGSDNKGSNLASPNVNGTHYTFLNGATAIGNTTWGNIAAAYRGDLVEGSDFLKIENPPLTDEGLLRIETQGIGSGSKAPTRGAIAALQLVFHPPQVTAVCDAYEGAVSIDGGSAAATATKTADLGETLSASLVATPAPGYRFVRWDGDTSIISGTGTATDPEVTVETVGRRQLNAVFALVAPYIYTLSVNFSGGRNTQNQVCPLTGTDSYGAFAVAGNCWNNISTCVTNGFTSLLWNDGVVLSGIAESNTTSGNWALGQDASANNIFYSYLDDNSTTTFTGLTRERGFPATCTVYVYTCNDGSTKFRPITVNGVAYTYVDDEVKPGTSDWGNASYAKSGSNNCVLGGDYLKIENVPVPADGTLVIAPQPTVNLRVARCGVAAIQVAFEVPSTFTVSASCDATRGTVQFGDGAAGAAVSATGTHTDEFSTTMRAIPALGYAFSHWTTGATATIEGGLDSSEVTVRTQLPARYVAVFIPDTTVFTATWTGEGQRGNLSDPANWVCRNSAESVLEKRIPGERTDITVSGSVVFDWPQGQTLNYRTLTMACELADDCDWRGFGAAGFTGTVDLKGHTLNAGTLFGPGAITDTSGGSVTGTVKVVVADGVSVTNVSAVLAGGVRLVKEGAGTFVAAAPNQTYTGGTDITAGLFVLGTSQHPMGTGDGTCDVTVRKGATIDINGCCGTASAVYNYTDLAGTIRISGSKEADSYDVEKYWHNAITLADDASIDGGWIYLGHNAQERMFSLNGHTLTLNLTKGMAYACNLKAESGRMVVTAGSLQTANPIPSQSLGSLDFKGDAYAYLSYDCTVEDFSYAAGQWWTHARATQVYVNGVYAAGANRPPITLNDGATLDLSAQTGVWSVDGLAATAGKNYRHMTQAGLVSFADKATICVDIGTRPVKRGAQLVSWSTKPANFDTLKFKAPLGKGYAVVKRETGVYLIRGLCIVLL